MFRGVDELPRGGDARCVELERRLAQRRAALAALAEFNTCIPSGAPLEVALRDKLDDCCRALGLPGGAVLLAADGRRTTWVFGDAGIDHLAADLERFLATDGGAPRLQACRTPVVWRDRRLGVLALLPPPEDAADDLEVVAHALAASVAQMVVLFEAVARIRGEEERYRQIFDSAVVGIYQSTPAGRFLTVNAAHARNLGYASPSDMMEAVTDIGRQVWRRPEERFELLLRLEEEDVVEDVEAECVGKDGASVWLSHSARAVRDDAGRIVRIDGIVKNIDARKRAEAALTTAHETLAAAQRRLNDVLSTSPAMSFVMSWEPDGSIRPLWVSQNVRRLTGYTAEEACSFEWWATHVHREDQPSIRAAAESLRATGRVVQQYRFRHRDGSYRWIRDEHRVARRLPNDALEVVGCWIDITDQKRAEEARSESARLYSAMVQDTPIGISRGDLEWRILEVNPAFARMVGYSADELVGRSFRELTYAEDVEACRVLWQQVVRGERDHYELEKRYVHKDGGIVWANLTVSALRDEDGRVRYGIGVVQDITERKKAENDLEQRRQVLSQAEKMADMGTLLAGVAHELNNPLSVVVGQAQLIAREAGEGSRLARRAQSLDQAADRCARIVHNFLSLARQRPPERNLVRVNQVIREALELIAYPLRVDRVEVELDFADGLPDIWADAHQFHQVVINLVTNAHHALRGRDGERRVTISTARAGDAGVRVRVSDSGPGVPEAIGERVFEPFFTTKPQGLGTGLGLPLCLGIAQAHGGTLVLEPYAEGAGASFVLSLPVGAPSGAAAGDVAAPVRSSARRSILVVDDEAAVGAVLAEVLAGDGHDVDVAQSGEEGLEKVTARAYHVVITDMKMPGLDGPGLFRAAAAALGGRPPFIFMTGDSLTPETAGFLMEPGRLQLEKPFRAQALRDVLERAVGGKEAARC